MCGCAFNRGRHRHASPRPRRYALIGDSSCASGFRKPLSKENHGFAVYHRPVPLAHDVEICSALAEWRAGAPAVGFQKIGRRGEHVRHAVPEIDVPVAEEYAATRVIPARIKRAKQLMQRHAALLARVERQFGVPATLLMALGTRQLVTQICRYQRDQSIGDVRNLFAAVAAMCRLGGLPHLPLGEL